MNRLHREWYDWTMKGGPRPAFLRKRVAYWVMGKGAEEWKYADDLASLADSTLTLYLDSEGGANDVLHSGRLTADRPPAGRAPDAYVYDPLDPRPIETLESAPPPADYYRAQATAFNLMGAGLVYHTEPFAEPTEISGTARLTAWISMDVPDTDFEVTLFEVLPDGSAIYLADDALRARYRDSPRTGRPVAPGEVTRFRFDQFTFVSRLIGKGSRLRLVLRPPNSLAWQKNYNSGGAVARETGKDARTARIRLHHDERYATALELPVVRPGRNLP
jgi:putative CocE/NonD family hydrolase